MERGARPSIALPAERLSDLGDVRCVCIVTSSLEGVTTFNLHPHLPHFEKLGDGMGKLDVLARQPIDPGAPPHPFTAGGRLDFDALLQSKPDLFVGADGRIIATDTGKGISFFRRGSDGRWRVAIDGWSSDRPAGR